MDLSPGPEYEAFRSDVVAFLAAHWEPDRRRDEEYVAGFRRAAVREGLLHRSVPRRFGGSEQEADPLRARVIREEFRAVGAPREVPGVGVTLLVPTLLRWGTPEQQERFLRPTVEGELRWCQGYSEPDAGSDLEGLRTTAVLDGDEWVINGQKVWTSQAHRAQWMFLLVRTEPERPRRDGISYLLVEMDQPGIDIRPLRQITGSAEFNEVFLDDVRTPADLLVGERGQGWAVSRTTLTAERTTLAGPDDSAALFESLVKLARRREIAGRPAIEDPAIRSRLMELHGWIEAQRCSALVQASRQKADGDVLPLVNKLLHTDIAQRVSAIALDLLGPASMLDPAGVERPGDERWLNQFFGSLGLAIAGGTSNIQRNLIAERGLGLPREPQGAA